MTDDEIRNDSLIQATARELGAIDPAACAAAVRGAADTRDALRRLRQDRPDLFRPENREQPRDLRRFAQSLSPAEFRRLREESPEVFGLRRKK